VPPPPEAELDELVPMLQGPTAIAFVKATRVIGGDEGAAIGRGAIQALIGRAVLGDRFLATGRDRRDGRRAAA